MAGVKRFEELECWKKARVLCAKYFDLCNKPALKRDFSLKDQLLRSSGSVMDNIAEGFERGGNKEFVQFLFIAKASCAEVKSQLYRAMDRNYLIESEFKEVYTLCQEISKMLNSLINFLRNTSKKGLKYQ
uniref:Four helix bundle protein n=1 Tax=Roseihalotalea indica TaxID=2867963 RepID=A0AA49GJF3_9BACT|nr:four helix bundle protein [Tunicatimonas sp. TK19036]